MVILLVHFYSINYVSEEIDKSCDQKNFNLWKCFRIFFLQGSIFSIKFLTVGQGNFISSLFDIVDSFLVNICPVFRPIAIQDHFLDTNQ